MGEAIVEGRNLYVKGINLTARLEAFCQPRGVSLSKSVHEFVSKKVEFSFSDLGDQQVKNTIVQAFELMISCTEQRDIFSNQISSFSKKKNLPKIAVMPLKKLSNNGELEYFTDGVTENIISNLSNWKSFSVISRQFGFTFQYKKVKTSEIAHEVNAQYIVEGSIRKVVNKVSIIASPVDGDDEQQVQTKGWDRPLDDIFEVQHEISQGVAAEVLTELKGKENERIKTKSPQSFTAWDSYLKG